MLDPLVPVGWCAIAAGFLTGAILGLGFHRSDWLGGYGSWPRRLLRLGHVSMPALGLIAIAAGFTLAGRQDGLATVARVGLGVGLVAMPVTCFLSAWRPAFRHLFPVPVLALVIGVTAVAALSL